MDEFLTFTERRAFHSSILKDIAVPKAIATNVLAIQKCSRRVDEPYPDRIIACLVIENKSRSLTRVSLDSGTRLPYTRSLSRV